MGDWLKNKLIGLGLGIVGLAAWLGYHSLIGDRGNSPKEEDRIPKVVFTGGGGNLTLAIEMNQTGYLLAEFSKGEEEKEKIRARQELKSGNHFFTIDLPNDLSYGYFELEIPDAPVGSKLSWRVELDGQQVLNEDENLSQPLKQNEAFFLQMEFNDLEEIRSYIKDKSGS